MFELLLIQRKSYGPAPERMLTFEKERISMKILSLDLGDKWVGTALSDVLKVTCKPYQTIPINQLTQFLKKILHDEPITVIVVGYPKTFSGGESDQTKKIVGQQLELEKNVAEWQTKKITWILWDERLSSKRAEELKRGSRDPEAKMKSHSIAAAFILQSYLDSLAFHSID